MAWVLNRPSIRECGKVQQAQVNAYNLFRWMIDDFLLHFTGENDVPVLALAFDSTGFHPAFYIPMHLDLDSADFGETHPVVFGQRKARLWKRKAVIAPVALKARVPGCFSFC